MACNYKKDDGSSCGSTYILKEVEFRHPNYEDLSIRIFLCETHFHYIFGKPILTQDHHLPLEEEEHLKRLYLNAKAKFEKDYKELREKVRVGVGLDYFDWDTWKFMNKLKVDRAFEKWNNLRKKTCRFEYCRKPIKYLKKPYIIRIFPKDPRDYVNLFFCSLDHWEIFKKRVGIINLMGKLNPKRKKVDCSLESYMEVKKLI